jgi:signal transduction histidine kinase/CheY-like chemotaxis protein
MELVGMQGTPIDSKAPPIDSSRSVLDFIQRLLTASNGEQPGLGGLLSELMAAFAASGAGVATLPDGAPLAVYPGLAMEGEGEWSLPWHEDPTILERLPRARTALMIPLPHGGSGLFTALNSLDRYEWILWLEDAERTAWTESEAAALFLAGQALTRWMTSDEAPPRWALQLDRSMRQQRLEAASRLVRRLAHDFGNVLTGILGFSELALAMQASPNTPLHAYLTEIYRGAQNGAHYTNQLRLFARRQTASNRSSMLTSVLAEEETRLRSSLGTDIQLNLELPANLPAVALDAEHLRQVLTVLLDNAREAIAGAGTITVSARPLELTPVEARYLFGGVRAGSHLEISVADTGSGPTPEAEQLLFSEPFFSTKPRKRGFGLAVAYGILTAHRGGLELVRQGDRTVARVVIPVTSAPVPLATRPSPSAQTTPRNDKVLVVDDDPMILRFVTTTLERAGFRVEAISDAEDALRAYTKAVDDPFRLVLSDVLMPNLSGIDLAKRLLAHDTNVRMLFMSGQVPSEFTQKGFAPGQFDVLPKPFRPEMLVRAVRSALDRVSLPRAVPGASFHDGSPSSPRASSP